MVSYKKNKSIQKINFFSPKNKAPPHTQARCPFPTKSYPLLLLLFFLEKCFFTTELRRLSESFSNKKQIFKNSLSVSKRVTFFFHGCFFLSRKGGLEKQFEPGAIFKASSNGFFSFQN